MKNKNIKIMFILPIFFCGCFGTYEQDRKKFCKESYLFLGIAIGQQQQTEAERTEGLLLNSIDYHFCVMQVEEDSNRFTPTL
ncbi:putative lipoprotein [Leptospira wolbachii serovar Codice str. CDC]|uniref:Lipoprotein n=1 Tax=Leptospira wolbachii serovar Codice str. CDC TaxID=1218599 RepID=R9A5M8_9LEPT|nr:hypothetical protein [Leptospira wolbachii]EOQ97299.1 putative lipoprotein [Leptospira wolbachii serovar Codice str. CDC]